MTAYLLDLYDSAYLLDLYDSAYLLKISLFISKNVLLNLDLKPISSSPQQAHHGSFNIDSTIVIIGFIGGQEMMLLVTL